MRTEASSEEIRGALSDLELQGLNPTLDRLGLLACNFSLQFAHDAQLSQYRLDIDRQPVSAAEVVGVLNAPLTPGRTSSVPALSNSFHRFLKSNSVVNRKGVEQYGADALPDSATNVDVHAILDLLDSTNELAWSRTRLPLFTQETIETELYRVFSTLSLREMNSVCSEVADLPEFPYKRWGRLSKQDQQKQIGWYQRGLDDEQKRKFEMAVRDRLFETFDIVSEVSAVFIPKEDLKVRGIDSATVHEVKIFDKVSSPSSNQESKRQKTQKPIKSDPHADHTYVVDFRTTKTFCEATPVIEWVHAPVEGRSFSLRPPQRLTNEHTGITVIRDNLLGALVVAALAPRAMEKHVKRFDKPSDAIAILAKMLSVPAFANTVITESPLTASAEQLAA